MARSVKFGKDGGLQARMVLTMFLLGLVYVAFVAALIAARAGAAAIVLFALMLLILQYFTADKIALATLGVKEVTPEEQPELHAIIDHLCIQADIPKPRVCIMEHQMPNAFAMGRSKKATTAHGRRPGCIAVARPQRNSKRVMAHESRTSLNRDVMVMTLASFFATLASMIMQFALSFFFFGGGYGRGNREQQSAPGDRDARLDPGLRDLVHAAARAFPLPRVRRRPGLGGAHRPAECTRRGVDQDQRHDRTRAPGRI